MGSAICLADTWTVDDDGKADFSSIQEAIDASSNGDFIYVQAGVYYEVIDFLGKAISVEGVDAQKVIIDGSIHQNAVTSKNSRQCPLS